MASKLTAKMKLVETALDKLIDTAMDYVKFRIQLGTLGYRALMNEATCPRQKLGAIVADPMHVKGNVACAGIHHTTCTYLVRSAHDSFPNNRSNSA